MKHYIIRLRDTELWVDRGVEFGHGGSTYYPQLKTDPLRVARYDTYEDAEIFAEKHIPEGHWVIHRLIPKTELTEKPDSETFTVSKPQEKLESQEVIVRVQEAEPGLIARIVRGKS